MAITNEWVRVPRPKAFLFCMSLRTGVEMISLSVLFNKVAGIFGLLAILTGYTLNATQISMYLYSITALIIMAYLMPYVREQSPMECLALAWFYTLDTIINTAYTAAFGSTLFERGVKDNISGGTPRTEALDDTAGFTSPKHNSSLAGASSFPTTGIPNNEGGAVAGMAAGVNITSMGPSAGSLANSAPGFFIVIALTTIRVYFIIVMMAYARRILRRHKKSTPSITCRLPIGDSSDGNPFATNMPAGQGWRGKLGRAMLCGGKHYFLGDQAEDDWEKGLNERFTPAAPSEPQGTIERERRARSGTGPPTPPPTITKI